MLLVLSSADRSFGEDASKQADAKKVAELVQELKGTNETKRRQAAVALGGMGAGAAPAVSALADALKDKDEKLRWAAALSLETWGRRRNPPCRD